MVIIPGAEGCHLWFGRECRVNLLFWIITGGIIGISAVNYYLSLFNLSFFIGLFVFVLICSVSILWSREFVCAGLILLGLGGFGLYSAYAVAQRIMLRDLLINRSFHASGVFNGNEFSVNEINGESAAGLFYCSAYTTRKLADYDGQEIALTGRLSGAFQNPDFANFLRRRGYAGLLQINTVHSATNSGSESAESQASGYMGRFKTGLNDFFDSNYQRWPRSIAYLRALVAGDREGMSRRLLAFFRRLGISHLFVISGLHVGFFCALFMFPLRKTPVLIQFTAVTLFLLLYLSFLTWPVSALRAGLMVWLYYLARALKRRTGFFSILISAVFIMMFVDPLIIFDAGFQLTVFAVLGIYLARPYAKLMPDYLSAGFIYTLGAYLGVLPAVIYHFGYIPRFGFLFSFLSGLIFPFFLLLLATQWLLIAVNWTFFADRVEWLYGWLEKGLNGLLTGIEPVIRVGHVAPFLLVLLAGGLLLLFMPQLKKRFKIATLALLIALLTVLFQPFYVPHMEVKNIGGNFVTHIHLPGSDYLIIPRRTILEPYDWYLIERYLIDKGIHKADTLVSEYTREMLAGLDSEIIFTEYWTYWLEDGSRRSGEIGYDFSSHKLSTPFAEIKYDNPDLLKREYNPEILVAQLGDMMVLGAVEKLSESEFETLYDSKHNLEIITAGSSWSYPRHFKKDITLFKTVRIR